MFLKSVCEDICGESSERLLKDSSKLRFDGQVWRALVRRCAHAHPMGSGHQTHQKMPVAHNFSFLARFVRNVSSALNSAVGRTDRLRATRANGVRPSTPTWYLMWSDVSCRKIHVNTEMVVRRTFTESVFEHSTIRVEGTVLSSERAARRGEAVLSDGWCGGINQQRNQAFFRRFRYHLRRIFPFEPKRNRRIVTLLLMQCQRKCDAR